ncbi:ATP-grasp fold amidoligase family protein [Serratia rhizosphaerae]|uniref:Glycosyltransferase n=1 Tax=Serratia rhizosphaerae TaxID=2597702 RepID=A0ABX6GS31_9GAMM|nr:ATP-grasp fold amidoligase family protein [Serratia rhizosphaerae]MEB6336457.1 glycosyltransferase [Serratia rhizosphaerae]QHA89050.1 glycosyltransferase [Serratia rhizosphaerae]
MLNRLLKGIVRCLPDALHHQVKYAMYFKRWPHLARPRGYSEKLMRRKIYPRGIYTMLSDKYKVREFIAGLWGEAYLTELYAHGAELSYDVFRRLPRQFVLKANHGSGYNRLVFDKEQVSYAELYDQTRRWMRANFYQQSRERHYRDIEPCIMVERLLLENDEVPNDLKFHCFNREGVIRIFIQVDYQRFGEHRRDIFDEQWNRTEIRLVLPNAEQPLAAPSQLADMLRLARLTAQQFSYLRVDFYQVGERVYFGELTFTPGAGLSRLMPERIEQEWGGYFID